MKSSPYGINRGSDLRFSVTTRSCRAPTSCFSAAGLSSLSLASGRAIEFPLQPFLDRFAADSAGSADTGRLVEADHRPLTAACHRQQTPIGIYRHRVAEGGQKWQVVVRVCVAP